MYVHTTQSERRLSKEIVTVLQKHSMNIVHSWEEPAEVARVTVAGVN